MQGVRGLERNRVEGTTCDEVLYADETICISQSETAMNALLAAIENEGRKYGLRLNRGKCEYLKFGMAGQVKFSNGDLVKSMDEVKSLGCLLNAQGDPGNEVGKRIKDSMATLMKMQIFFRHGDSTFSEQLNVFNAVLASKLMYGLESVVMNKSVLNRLDTFQLKGLRKILHIPKTYFDRRYTNDHVLMQANKALQREGKGKLTTLSECHIKRRKTLLAKLIVLGKEEPSAEITFNIDTLTPHDYGKKRVGRPRLNWLECTLTDAWKEPNAEFTAPDHFQAGNMAHANRLKEWAQGYDQKYEWSSRLQNSVLSEPRHHRLHETDILS